MGHRSAARYELIDGERVTGVVLRVPQPAAPHGNHLILDTDRGPIAIPASAKRGATVLGRELVRQGIRPGDRVAITYAGIRQTVDRERRYRAYVVNRMEADKAAA